MSIDPLPHNGEDDDESAFGNHTAPLERPGVATESGWCAERWQPPKFSAPAVAELYDLVLT
jgi:hypothetical protein